MAPRPVTGRAQKVPWYKTTKGQTIAAISALVLVVVGLSMFSSARKEADEREQAQASLEDYTDQIRALQTRVAEPATEMAAVVTEVPEDLAAKAKEWNTAFTEAQGETSQLFAPEGADASGQLFTQSINLFKAAAETLAVAGGLEGKQQQDLISAASTQVQSAGGVWDAGVTILEDARDDAELGAAGISSPVNVTQPPTQATPDSPTATIPVEPEEDEGSGGTGGGEDSDGGGKDKKGDDS